MQGFITRLLLLISVTKNPEPSEWTPNPLEGDLLLPMSTVTIYHPSYGVRNVTYYVSDGNAIIDGDIIFGPVEQLMAHVVNPSLLRDIGPDTESSIYEKRALTWERGRNAWPNARLSYNFDSANTERVLGNMVRQAFARWTATAPWFTFTKVPNNPRARGVLTFKTGLGCSAHVGYLGANAEMPLNLEQTPGRQCGVDEATHEIGHALGFYHEHQRADRERTVHFNCAALMPACPAGQQLPPGRNCCGGPYPNGCCQLISNFNIMQGPGIDNTGQYDITSTMQYRRDSFALAGQATLVAARAGVQVPTRNIGFPSRGDFDRLCKLYPGQCRARKTKVIEVEEWQVSED